MPHWNKVDWPVEKIRHWIEVEKRTHKWVGSQLGRTDKVISDVCKRYKIKSQRRGPRSGSEHPDWKGGRYTDKYGYVWIYSPDHPNKRKNGTPYVQEHRLVMEKYLNRLLTKKEVVHHINKNLSDNKIENLKLYPRNSDHLRDELTGKIPNWTEE